jgi:hypothetical protein
VSVALDRVGANELLDANGLACRSAIDGYLSDRLKSL